MACRPQRCLRSIGTRSERGSEADWHHGAHRRLGAADRQAGSRECGPGATLAGTAISQPRNEEAEVKPQPNLHACTGAPENPYVGGDELNTVLTYASEAIGAGVTDWHDLTRGDRTVIRVSERFISGEITPYLAPRLSPGVHIEIGDRRRCSATCSKR
jgi:hypothetical protein